LSADCTAVADRRRCPTHWRAGRLEDLSLIRTPTRPKTQERLEPGRGTGRKMQREKVREREVRVMSYCRARRESARRRVKVLKDPLAPDTDRHHRRIRERVVDCWTDGCAGRDEKDVGVRSCSCGVAEKKSATEWLTGTADITHAKSGTFILFGMARYGSCARARMVLSPVAIVQQHVNGMTRHMACLAS
jgi:hypothetical protein